MYIYIYIYNRNEDIPSVKRIRAEIRINFNTGSRRASCNVTRHGSSVARIDRVSHDRTFLIPLNRSFPKSLLASVGFQRFRRYFERYFHWNFLICLQPKNSLCNVLKKNESSFSRFRKEKVEKKEYGSLNSCSTRLLYIVKRREVNRPYFHFRVQNREGPGCHPIGRTRDKLLDRFASIFLANNSVLHILRQPVKLLDVW